ncbi:MAG: FISUMP domain-containing protein [Breznakibacter sp.]
MNGYEGTNISSAKAHVNYNTYGVLYNWTAACNVCPPGWHLPTETEWTTLPLIMLTFDVKNTFTSSLKRIKKLSIIGH